MRLLLQALAVVCAPTLLAAGDANWRLQAHARSFNLSEPVSVVAAFDGFRAQRVRDGRALVSYSEAGLQGEYRGVRLGVRKRVTYGLDFSEDAARALFAKKNDNSFATAREYAIDVRARHVEILGLTLGVGADVWPGVRVVVDAHYLHADAFTDGRLTGSIALDASAAPSGDLVLDHRYTRDEVLGRRRLPDTDGRGLAVDVGVAVRAGERVHASLVVHDAYGVIRWPGAPFTHATIASDTFRFDAQGRVTVQPTLEGIESAANFTQRLPRRFTLDARYALSSCCDLRAGAESFGRVRLPWLGAAWHIGAGRTLEAAFVGRANALRVSFLGQRLAVTLTLDRLRPRDAHVLGVDLAVATGQ